jgi:hypothetical protein
MTINNANNKNQFTANGINDTFTYTFKIFLKNEIVVDVDGVPQVITTDYNVTGVGLDAGGDIVFTGGSIPANLAIVTLQLSPDFTQEIDYVENDEFPSSSHEEGLDRGVQRDLNLSEEISRTLQVPLNTVVTFDSTLPTPSAGLALKWNPTEDALINSTVDPDTQTDAAAASASAAASSASAASTSETNAATSETNAATSETNAATSETNAEEWATKIDGVVDSGEFASKAYAIGGTGVTNASGKGAAKEWATNPEDSTVDTVGFSALHYSAKAAASALAAQGIIFGTAAGSSNAYTLAGTPTITAYATGQVFTFIANHLSTGAATLNVESLGARNIKLESFFDLPAFAIKNGQAVTVFFDGTNMQPLYTWPVTGDIIHHPAQTKSGYLELDGTITVGSSSSGAANAGDEFEGIFRLLWDNVDNAEAPVSSGRGGSAAADFSANKTLTLPDYNDASVMGVNSTLSKAGKTAGASTVASTGSVGTSGATTLTSSQVPVLTFDFQVGSGAPANSGSNTYFGASNSGVTATAKSPTTIATGSVSSNAGGGSHSHSGGSFSGNATSVLHPVVGAFVLMKI